jgi:uncharacterized RDD family membrane protein YckC
MTDWHVNREGRLAGPFTEEQIREFATVGRLVPTDLLRRTGDTGWRMAQTIEGLFPAQAAPVEAVAAPPPPAPPPPVVRERIEPRAASSGDTPRFELAAQAFRDQKWGGFWQRFAANIVDGLVLLTPTVLVVWAFATSKSSQPASDLQFYAPLFCVNVVYHTLFLAGAKVATPGRMAAGIAIVDADTGEPIPAGRALLRSAMSWLGYLLILPNLVMLFTRRRQTVADLIARTVAVRYKTGNAAIVPALALCGVALAGVLGAIALPQYQSFVIRERTAAVRSDLAELSRRVEGAWRVTKKIPTSLSDLDYQPASTFARFSILGNGTIVADGISREQDFVALRPHYDQAANTFSWDCISGGITAAAQLSSDCPETEHP